MLSTKILRRQKLHKFLRCYSQHLTNSAEIEEALQQKPDKEGFELIIDRRGDRTVSRSEMARANKPSVTGRPIEKKIIYSSFIEQNSERVGYIKMLVREQEKIIGERQRLLESQVTSVVAQMFYKPEEEAEDKVPEAEPDIPVELNFPYKSFTPLKETKTKRRRRQQERDFYLKTEEKTNLPDEWMSDYGSADPDFPVSDVACNGCGAHLHCKDTGMPGFIPSERFKLLSRRELFRHTCQRCFFLKEHNMALKVSVSPEDYVKVIGEVKNKHALVLLVVDLLDFPSSVWPGIMDIIGSRRPVILIGNKVDLVPLDGSGSIERMKTCLVESATRAGLDEANLKHVALVSAKTGFGIEELITKLWNSWRNQGDIYILGCTNVGKSSLFNALLQSDMCKSDASDLVERATTSVWPGTTLNLLKFPVTSPSSIRMFERTKRLIAEREQSWAELQLQKDQLKNTQNPIYASLMGKIGRTFMSNRKIAELEQDVADPFAVQSRSVPQDVDDRPVFDPNRKNPLDPNPKFCLDTPGTVHEDQILTLLTMEELDLVVPRQLISPRSFLLRPGNTFFLGGLGRIDVLEADDRIIFTVYASDKIPVAILKTEDAESFLKECQNSPLVAVPSGGEERMKLWPEMQYREFDLRGIWWEESVADITLSSADRGFAFAHANRVLLQHFGFVAQEVEEGEVRARETIFQTQLEAGEGNLALRCDFGKASQSSFCQWLGQNSSEGGSPRVWRIGSGKTAFLIGGPTLDTEGDPEGFYAFIDTSYTGSRPPVRPVLGTTAKINLGARLPSPILGSTGPDGRCISLRYNIHGLSASKLQILLRNVERTSGDNSTNAQVISPPKDGANHLRPFGVGGFGTVAGTDDSKGKRDKEIVLWESWDQTEDQWRSAAVIYSKDSLHQLIILGVSEDISQDLQRHRGFIAIDNLEFTSAMEPASACRGYCTFENGFCSWTNDNSDDFDWIMSIGSGNPATGAVTDHSSSLFGGGLIGGFASLSSAYPRKPGDVARLISTDMTSTDIDTPKCLRFWTHMYGSGVGSLTILVRVSGRPDRKVWSLSGNAGGHWHQGQVPIASEQSFKIIFQGEVGKNHFGDIGLDDVTLMPGACPTEPQTASVTSMDCSFEGNECRWSNLGPRDGLDELDWQRVSGDPTKNPAKDHSTGKGGFFMSLDRNGAQRPGDRAILVSKDINGTESQMCLSFWYFMHESVVDPAGPMLGIIRIHVKKFGSANKTLTTIWSLPGPTGPSWVRGQVPLTEIGLFKVYFEGMWGSNRNIGVIALDDVVIYSGTCNAKPKRFISNEMECLFDRDTCGWNVIPGPRPDIEWKLASIARRPANLPDHTFNAPSGYIFFDIFVQGQRQELAKLVSFSIQGKDGQPRNCITFWFAAYGAGDTTHLKLSREPISSPSGEATAGAGVEIWSIGVGQMDISRPDWTFGQASYDASGLFRLVFEGKANNGGFAVDDIRVFEEDCQTRPTLAVPKKTAVGVITTTPGSAEVVEPEFPTS